MILYPIILCSHFESAREFWHRCGRVRFEDLVEGQSVHSETDSSGNIRRTVIEHKGDLHPQIVLEDADGKPLDVYYLPERAHIEVAEGKFITAGSVLAKTPREASAITDITGGLPRVTEIFEARKPKDPAAPKKPRKKKGE